jgi:hypothetical protein
VAHAAGEAIHPGLGEYLAPQSEIEAAKRWTGGPEGPGEGTGSMLYNIAEYATMAGEAEKGVAGAAKIVSGSEKLKRMAEVVNVLEKYPRLQSILGAAMMQGGVAAAQGLAHGEDVGTAVHQGEATGAIAGGFAGLSSGAEGLLRRNAATFEDVGGVKTVVPAEVRNARPTPQQAAGQESIRRAAQETLGSHLEEVNASRRTPVSTLPALPARTGPFEFQLRGVEPTPAATPGEIQRAAPFSAANTEPVPWNAQNVERMSTIPAENQVEGGPGAAGYRMTSGTKTPARPGAVSAGEEAMYRSAGRPPRPVQTPEAAPVQPGGELRTQDPNVAKLHVANLNEIVGHEDFAKLPEAQQGQILDARTDAQRQLRAYHDEMDASTSAARERMRGANFPQIDIPSTVQRVGSYTDAANYLEGTATGGYQAIADALALNDISGGKYTAIRNANREAWNAYTGATSPEALHGAENAIDETNRQMMDLLHKDIQGAVTPKELDGFNAAYSSAQKLKYVAHAVDSSFSGNASAAARSWEYRGFDGDRLMENLDRLEQKYGRDSLERMVGKDQWSTLRQVAELNRTGAARARFGAAVKPVAEWLSKQEGLFSRLGPAAVGGTVAEMAGGHYLTGMAVGTGMAMATKNVMNAVLSNPKIAGNLIFAMEAGARPQVYGPFIGALIQRYNQPQAPEPADGGGGQ